MKKLNNTRQVSLKENQKFSASLVEDAPLAKGVSLGNL